MASGLQTSMPSLNESLCKVFGHEWINTGSGIPERPKCTRCSADYIKYMYEFYMEKHEAARKEGKGKEDGLL